jgi:hypothetical protein
LTEGRSPAAFDEAVRESAAELKGTKPWWRPDATVADQEAWARFTREAWTQGRSTFS